MQKHDSGKGLKKKMVFGCWSCQILISGVIWIQIVLVGVAIIVEAVVCEYHVSDNEIRNHRVHFTQLFRRTFFLHMIFAKSMGLRQVCSFFFFSLELHLTHPQHNLLTEIRNGILCPILYIYIFDRFVIVDKHWMDKRHSRYADLNDVMRQVLQSSGIPSLLEPNALGRAWMCCSRVRPVVLRLIFIPWTFIFEFNHKYSFHSWWRRVGWNRFS